MYRKINIQCPIYQHVCHVFEPKKRDDKMVTSDVGKIDGGITERYVFCLFRLKNPFLLRLISGMASFIATGKSVHISIIKNKERHRELNEE